MGDKNARSILQCENPLHRGHIILEGRLRLLDDADIEAVLDKNVVDAFPARTVRPGAVNEDDIRRLRRQHSLIHRERPFSRGNAGIASCTRGLSSNFRVGVPSRR